MKIGKQFRFEAAHQLPNHDGKCRRLHGHSYMVEVVMAGDPKDADGSGSEGMLVDFSHVSLAVKTHVIDKLDHRNLNDVILDVPTTAENIAVWIADQLTGPLTFDNAWLDSVTVWETATSWARFDTA